MEGGGKGEKDVSEKVFVDWCTTFEGTQETATANLFDVQSHEQQGIHFW